VVAEHGATVLRVCRAVLGSHPDAEDAWSETFVAALRAWPTLDAGANVQAWLVTIAHRKALDVVRARSRRAVPVEHPLEPPDRGSGAWGSGAWSSGALGSSNGGSGDGRSGDAAEVEDLRTALASLPAKQRQVLAYHYLGGLPYAEVAALVGGTAEAARRAAADGRRSLRATLTREELR